LTEPKSGALPEPVGLTDSQLDVVAGGQATGFVKQRNKARVSIGNNASITNSGTGDVSVGTGNMVMITRSNSKIGSITAAEGTLAPT
jgi:hypothetical protein